MGNCLIYKKGGEGKVELIWTNSNPSSAFSTQTVPLNATKYKFFLISVYFSTSALTNSKINIVMNDGNNYLLLAPQAQPDNTTFTSVGICKTTSDGIYFNRSSYQDYSIPNKIWGIKF